MYEGKYRSLQFSVGKSHCGRCWEPVTSGQLQSIHLKPTTVVWIAGNIDLGDNSSSVPSTPPFLWGSQLSCVWLEILGTGRASQTLSLEAEKGVRSRKRWTDFSFPIHFIYIFLAIPYPHLEAQNVFGLTDHCQVPHLMQVEAQHKILHLQ